MIGYVLQYHRYRILVFGRRKAANRDDVGLQEVDVRAFGNQEAADIGVVCIGVKIFFLVWLLVNFSHLAVGYLYSESIFAGAIYGKCHLTAQFLYIGIYVAFVGTENQRARDVLPIDIIAPLGIEGGCEVKADSSVFSVSCTSTICIVGDYKDKVLVIRVIGRVDVEVEHRIPLFAIGYYVILGESSPPTGGEICISDGVHIFLHAFKHLLFRLFLRIFNFLYLIGNPVGGVYVIKFAIRTACQCQ